MITSFTMGHINRTHSIDLLNAFVVYTPLGKNDVHLTAVVMQYFLQYSAIYCIGSTSLDKNKPPIGFVYSMFNLLIY